ncbi:MAG: SIS domain-containing protein [Patescibacteria group bacterium]
MKKNILDSLEEIQKLDKSNMLGSIDALDKQITHAWEDANNVKTQDFASIQNVVVAGMGGSGLGADVIKTAFKSELKVPLDFVHSYTLPNYVNKNTLLLLASYSGNTEEVLECHTHAADANAQIMMIAAGGELAKTADAFNYPIYLINPKYNPSNQPRMAIGYAVFGTIVLLAKAGVIKISEEEVKEVVEAINSIQEACAQSVTQENNLAKQLAWEMFDRRPILVAAEHMEGAIHVSTNQFNENAKIFADYKIIPEINHHLMEGLGHPKTNESSHLFVLINSKLYLKRNQTRFKLTKQLIEKNHISTREINLKAKSKLAQVFESIAFFAYTNFYLSMLEGIDPSPIPFVDWFKDELKKA